MPEVQIGKYRRPGIFIEEFDNSIIETPIVEGISTLAIGFSKKGPVNAPVVVETLTDFENIFGSLDRFVEKKGSFFHRTVAKLLESNPVICMNLLLTDDELDTLEYKSFSTSTAITNDIKRTGPYRRFFDTTGFWKKDTESFLNLVDNNPGDDDRILHFTNMGDKNITVFTFKSQQTNLDISLIDWYGAREKVPTYLYETDLVSDYLVDVLVVAGDWTDYQSLAVDPRWSNYFNTQGLRKDQVENFANDINVTVLRYYLGLSLIPYFRDQNGRNIFIESVINRDTNFTGLFCAFDIEALETDLPKGLIDLVGNNLITGDVSSIEYLSYQTSVTEALEYEETLLDTPGNVLSMGSLYRNTGLDRTAFNAEGYVDGVTTNEADFGYNPNPSPSPSPFSPSSDTSFTVTFDVADGAYAIIGGNKITLNDSGSTIQVDFEIQASNYIDLADGLSTGTLYKSTFTIDSNGEFKHYANTANNDNPIVSATDIVLGYVEFEVTNDGGVGTGTATNYITNIDFTYVTVDDAGFIDLADVQNPYSHPQGTNGVPRYDYTVTSDGSGNITWEFNNTASTADPAQYEIYRRFKFFNAAISFLDGPNKNEGVVLIDGNNKVSLENVTITNIVTSSAQNKAFTLQTGLDDADIDDILGGSPLNPSVCIYVTDNEFVMGTDTLQTTTGLPTLTSGVVGYYSDFLNDFRNGIINSGDYFHEQLLDTSDTWDVSFEDNNGNDYIVFFSSDSGANIDFVTTNLRIVIPQATANTGVFTIIDPNNKASNLGYGSGYFAYLVNENTTPETVTDVTKVFDFNNKHYLKMYFDSNGDLQVEFMEDNTLSIPNDVEDITRNTGITIFSQKTNFRQSIEIESPTGYTQEPNKILIDADRYTEVKVGDYLEAYVDESSLEVGEVPKRLTRILTKRLYSEDTSLVEITTDARIKKYDFNGDLQTLRITNVDDYVNTYKGITMKGFKVRQESTPDGTEERQNDILNLIEEGSPLFNALTNKDVIDFRYVVDTFGLGLTERSKQQLVDLCGERLDCFGFINMPSMRSFKNSSSPTFVNNEGVLQTEFVAQGGDPESTPAFLYSFGDGSGVTSVGYFCPYLTVSDNGRPIDVPPAMYVASTYLRKLNSTQTNVQPWTIAAGVTNGLITGIIDVEQEFTNADIENLNGMKANPIVTKRNRGFAIETENTAQTLVTSALSFIHVREVLIELERRLADMLLEFQWRFNTPEIRAEIKLRADQICESFVNNDGLFNFFNKIDEENNTPDIIDNQIGVLDTYVEPIKGMGIIVNNVTILRTGAIASGGFL